MRSWLRLFSKVGAVSTMTARAALPAAALLAAVSCVYPDASTDRLREGAARDVPSELEESSDAGVDAAPADDDGSAAERTACGATFGKDILPAFVELGCTSIACHGTRLRPPRIEAKDAKLTYDALVAYAIGVKPYVKPGSKVPEESALYCHLRGQCGTRMPPNGEAIPKALIDKVDVWLACGAPSN